MHKETIEIRNGSDMIEQRVVRRRDGASYNDSKKE